MALSDWLPLSLQIGSTILSAGGTMARGSAYRTIGARRRAASEFEAAQLDAEAEQSVGLGMRAATEEVRKARYVESSQLARAAASGAGASDPTVMNIIARTAGEGSYRSAVAMYEGEAQARLDRLRAAGARYEGAQAEADAGVAASQASLATGATLLSGGLKSLTLYDKYFSGPKPNSIDAPQQVSSYTPRSWLDAGTEMGNTG